MRKKRLKTIFIANLLQFFQTNIKQKRIWRIEWKDNGIKHATFPNLSLFCNSGRKVQVLQSSYHFFFGLQSSFGFADVGFYQGNQFALLVERPKSRVGRYGFDIFYTRVIDYQSDSYIVLYSCEEYSSIFGRRAKENVWVLSRTWNQGEASLQNIEKSIISYTHIPSRRLLMPQYKLVDCRKNGFS